MSCTCSSVPAPDFYCGSRDLNQEIKDSLELFVGSTRKAMKLIAKKYIIIELKREPPLMLDEKMFIREHPLIVVYVIPELNMMKFEWMVYPNEMIF